MNKKYLAFIVLLVAAFQMRVGATEMSGGNPGNITPAGSASAGLYTGAFMYEYPIKIPAGRNGLQPDLRLIYNSQAGNGWIGSGWDLSFGSIHRSTKNGIPKYDDTLSGTNDIFVYTLGGGSDELVKVGEGSDAAGAFCEYRPSLESAFTRFRCYYTSADGALKWVAADKSGKTYVFEGLVKKEISTGVFRFFHWGLTKVKDTNGNFIAYNYPNATYTNNVLHAAPSYYQNISDYIQYTGHEDINGVADIGPKYQVNFEIEQNDRPDVITNYRAGVKQTINKRLKYIWVYSNGALLKKYELNYSLTASNLSLLSSISEIGSDGVSVLYTTSFNYDQIVEGFSAPGCSFIPGEDFTSPDDLGYTFHEGSTDHTEVGFMDINGDGLPDHILKHRRDNEESTYQDNFYIRLNNSSSFFAEKISWTAPADIWDLGLEYTDSNSTATHTEIAMLDITGDGLPDHVRKHRDENNFSVRKNLGNGFGYAETWGIAGDDFYLPDDLKFTFKDGPTYRVQVDMTEINGDGLPDHVMKCAGNSSFYIRLNTGSGFAAWVPWPVAGDTWDLSSTYVNDSQNHTEVGFMDINGDGLPDHVRKHRDNDYFQVRLNTGSGFADEEQWAIGANDFGVIPDDLCYTYNDGSTNHAEVGFMDINGDGLPDHVLKHRNSSVFSVRYNTGKGFAPKVDINASGDYYDSASCYTDNSGSQKHSEVAMVDFNGDGTPDHVRKHRADNFFDVIRNILTPRPLLSKITNGLGGTTEITYTQSAERTVDMHLPVFVVSSVKTGDGRGNYAKKVYEYSGGKCRRGTPAEREFLGFKYVTEKTVNPSNDALFNYQITKYLQDEDISYGTILYKGRVDNRKLYNADGSLFSEEIYEYDTIFNLGVYFPHLRRVTRRLFGTTQRATETAYEYDSYGNVTRVTTSGDDTPLKVAFTDYAYYPDAYIMGLPAHTRLADALGNTVSERWYYYDGATARNIPPLKGNLTRQEAYNDNGANPVSEYVYDQFGNMVEERDARWVESGGAQGNRIVKDYETNFYQYVSTITNSAGQRESFTYNNAGAVVEHTDINGQKTVSVYDIFMRPLSTTGPCGSETLYAYSINPAGPPHMICEKTRLNPAKTLDTYEYIDGLGRTINKLSPAQEGSQMISGEVTYNALGLVERSYLPRITGSAVGFREPVADAAHSVALYDVFGRLTKLTAPDGGETQHSYDGWNETVTFNNVADGSVQAQVKDYVKDGYGRILEVHEHNDCEEYITRYAYNLADNLTGITNSKSEVTEIGYDSLGRKTSMSDPAMGYWLYEYDINGNLLRQTDSRLNVSTMTYDNLGRITQKSYPEAGSNIYYVYDSTANGAGRLASVRDASGITMFAYDEFGRNVRKVRQLSELNGGGQYVTSNEYDLLGRETKLTYPDNDSVNMEYSGNALSAVKSGDNLVTYASFGYDNTSHGKLSSLNFGNGVVTTYGYNSQSRRLSLLNTVKAGAALQNLAYSYDLAGNITGISDGAGGMSQGYIYDELNRLIVAISTGSYVAKCYSYSRTGDIETNPDSPAGAVGMMFDGAASGLTLNGAAYCNGSYGQGLSFDGVGTARISSYGIPRESLTIEFWSMRGSLGASGEIAGKAGSFAISCDTNGYINAGLNIGGSWRYAAGYGLGSNVWKHIALSYDGSIVRLYINGSIVSSTTANGKIESNSNTIVLGSGFSGRVDEFNLWGRALSYSEIYARYALVPNNNPDKPKLPSGKESVTMNEPHAYTFNGWDVNGDSICYVVDWGDSVVYSTSPWNANGSMVVTSHTWISAGSYGVRVKVVDEHGAESSWSPVYIVGVYAKLNYEAKWPEPRLVGASGDVSFSSCTQSSDTVGENVRGKSFGGGKMLNYGYSGAVTVLQSLRWDVVQVPYSLGGDEAQSPQRASLGEVEQMSAISDIVKAIGQYAGNLLKDSNGNHVISNNRWIKYDYDNRPIKVVNADGTSEEYTYDYSGQRVKKRVIANGSEAISVYIGTVYEKTGGNATKNIYANGKLIATKKNTGELNYYHSDHLGSTNLLTDGSGNVVSTTTYTPYGAMYQASGTSASRKYTGQIFDSGTGLYYYNARYYDPQLGIFITPDIFIQNLYDPQCLNRYAYCRNNPIIYTDPSGNIFGIDDLLFIAICAVAGGVNGGTHGFSQDLNKFDWNAAGQGALTGAAIGAGIAGLGALTGFDTALSQTFNAQIGITMDGYTLPLLSTNGLGASASVAASAIGGGMLPSSLSLPSNKPESSLSGSSGPTSGPIRPKNYVSFQYEAGQSLRNPNVIKALQDLAVNLAADLVYVSGGDRSSATQVSLKKQGFTPASPSSGYHCAAMGYKAADARFYRGNTQVGVDEVRNSALGIMGIGGIGTYYSRNFNHIDIRDRIDGNVAVWYEK